VPLKIGSNNLKTPDTVIDKIMDYLAVCRLTLERGHQSHLFCHQASVSISSRIILSVALEIPSRSKGAEREPGPLTLVITPVRQCAGEGGQSNQVRSTMAGPDKNLSRWARVISVAVTYPRGA
jgi:hypothetical protein